MCSLCPFLVGLSDGKPSPPPFELVMGLLGLLLNESLAPPPSGAVYVELR